jgi:tetratricopeptide (TPR) repeat protein
MVFGTRSDIFVRRSSSPGLLILLLTGCDPVSRGDKAWEAGEVERAVTAWQDAEELDPDHQGRLARALIRLGQLDAAARTLDVLPREQWTAEGQLASGLLLLHLGDLPGASEEFGAGLKLAPLPELLVNQCMALGQLEHLTARTICQQAIEADPQDPRPYLGLAAASVDELQDAAREAIGIAIARIGPQGTRLRTDLAPWIGELWLDLGEVGAACSWGIEGGVGDLATAQACIAAGRSSEARPILEVLAVQDAGQTALRLLLQQDLDRAEQATQGPAKNHALASADRWFQRLLPLLEDSSDPGWLNDRGRLAWLAGQPAEAEELWIQALVLAPSEAAPRLNQARALERRGKLDEAMSLLRGAVEAGTEGNGKHAVQLALARMELSAGMTDAAWARLEEVHTACIAQGQTACAARAALELARLEAPAGRIEQAIRHLEQALSFGGLDLRQDISRDVDFDALRSDIRFRQLIAEP